MKGLNIFALISLLFCLSSIAQAKEAFGHPGIRANWSSAKKTNVGTFLEGGAKLSPVQRPQQKSLVWFTNTAGVLTEVFFPTIDLAQIKDSQLLVSDGKTFFQEEKDHLSHSVEIVTPYHSKLINRDKKGRFKITHSYFTLKDSSTLIDEIEVDVKRDGLSFYLLTNPHLNNTGAGDHAYVHGEGFKVVEGATNMLITSTVGFTHRSVGFVGSSDGHQDLSKNFQMNYHYTSARNGNIATTGRLNLPAKAGRYKFYVVYQFSQNDKALRPSGKKDYAPDKAAYLASWKNYLSTIKVPKNLSAERELLYKRSLFVLKTHEDKLNPGALIASLSVPWGETQYETHGADIGGYHLIWPRDLYHVAMGLLSAGDLASPMNALRFLKKIQYKKNSGQWDLSPRIIRKEGAFPQNTWVSGVEYWGGMQIDQVGYPIHLFYQVYLKVDAKTQQQMRQEFGVMLAKALNFIQTNGPWSQQERWEENFGISPSSFAVATSALVIGSKIFQNNFGKSLAKTANAWLHTPGDNIDTWTFTNSGVYDDGQYYLRVSGCQSYSAVWDPNNRQDCHVANSSRRVEQSQFLDQGFLKLALLGLKNADDYKLLTSQEKVNRHIRVKTPNGYGWYRYSFDAYGENGKGRLWPLLSSEHGRFAIERFRANNLSWKEAVKKVDTILESYQGFANTGMMIPEQVFENTGEGTGGATPLAWSHAEFIKLLWSKELRRNVENVLK